MSAPATPSALRRVLRVLPGHAARPRPAAVAGTRVRPAGLVHQLGVDPAGRAGLDPVRRGHRAAARLAGPPARRAVVHRRRVGARRGPRGRPDRHRADHRRRRRLGDLRRPGRPQDPRGAGRDAGARHRPDPAPRGAPGARLDAGRRPAQRPGQRRRRDRRLLLQRGPAGRHARARTWPASRPSGSCPTCWSARSRRCVFGADRRARRLLQGHDRARAARRASATRSTRAWSSPSCCCSR